MRMSPEKTSFFISDHPLVKHKLAHMRKTPEECPSREFVRLMREMGMLLGYEATKTLPVQEKKIETDRSGKISVVGIFSQKPVIVPILRTGLVMAEGLKEIVPTTYTGHIGLHNDHESKMLREYMVAIPGSINSRIFIVVDPVIATGATACRAIQILKDFHILAEHIRYVSIIVTKNGKERIMEEHPLGIQIYAATDADILDGTKLIPGLGSISSRLYRTS
jgi:uracil phosphoribosyltransferase